MLPAEEREYNEVRHMPRIIFSALPFLQQTASKTGNRLLRGGYEHCRGHDAGGLMGQLGLAREAVEAVLINGKAGDMKRP